jgi:hypothetical protein
MVLLQRTDVIVAVHLNRAGSGPTTPRIRLVPTRQIRKDGAPLAAKKRPWIQKHAPPEDG